jgi:transcriptional regulator with GAF, ATPase, and Fis domain
VTAISGIYLAQHYFITGCHMAESAKQKGGNVASRRRRDLAEELKRQTGQLAAINTVTAAVSQSLDLNVTLETALDAVLSVIPVDASGISMIDEAAGELVLRAQRGWRKDFVVNKPMRIKRGQGLSWLAINKDEVIITGDVSNDPRLVFQAFSEEQVQAMVLAPMHARGRVIGILSVMSHKPYNFDHDEVRMLRAIADQVGLALDNARLFESVKEEQSRLQAVLQSTADAIIATDSMGHITLVNQAASELFELDPDKLIDSALRDAPLPPLSRQSCRPYSPRVDSENSRRRAGLPSSRISRTSSRLSKPAYSSSRRRRTTCAIRWV